ncbi:Rad4-domain-containing protein [Aspergillus sclerotioniger CBS 115572]|uniref:Rad4-domain-containing protein n=1 Tax=Aspergillus sclerotioniger CBS 115572 TaxID=1450535 RepID=A0A317XBK6_9EURO|nr:Rad4-domain-containing protein [Aspergillus sclerotioniger CBS 115572]PWY94997.1 Rad4-domain-containing protein [Aspergillus sclerotioniger CBS 115572]
MARRTATTRSARAGASSRPRRRQQDQEHDIPEVYREMLAEAEAREQSQPEDAPRKRRKLAGQKSVSSPRPLSREVTPQDTQPAHHVQTVYDSPSSSEESDMEWEEVDIHQTSYNNQTDDTSIQVTLDRPEDQKRKVVPRRRVITAAEKQLRLNIHKVHLLCLLLHVQIRNLWCNNEEVQGFLKRMLPKQIIGLLHPSEKRPQQTRSTTFVDGLNQASDAFNRRFKVTAPGLKRPFWIDNPDSLKKRAEHIISDAEIFLSREDFTKQAKTLQGSRDFGAQLFCALLRSVGVEARLVCSLQPLPFSGTTKDVTPPVVPDNLPTSSDSPGRSAGEARISQRSNLRRIGRPQFAPQRPRTPTRKMQGSPNVIRESSHPIFWVEALNEALNKWIPIDTLVTKSLGKPSKFEPPASDPYNIMSYVVAFEDDASARDVTRRYAKAFNAKTRKLRIESVKSHVNWWNKALLFYEKPFLEDRDELEISELTSKMAAEPMPRNIQDFKGHPFYALERHLRRNEVVFPKRVIGQVTLGKTGTKNQVLEPVYRRSDVHALRSADRWYRLGRDIKTGEQPLKCVPSRKPQAEPFDEADESIAETPLYAYCQTQIYQPPPVVRGRIPKNMYGNLDVFVPSMVPPGGVHITHPDAAYAAKLLAIDYADAVTGFNFSGRHGTAILQGVVIASEYQEALEEVIGGLESEKMEAELERKSAEALRLWRHFLLKLRIAERVKGYMVEGDTEENPKDVEDVEQLGGGFLPEPEEAMMDNMELSETQEHSDKDISMSAAPDVLGGGFIPEASANEVPLPLDNNPRGAHTNHPTEFPQYSLVVVPKIGIPDQTTSIQGFTGAPRNTGLLPESQREELGYPPQVGNHPSDASFVKATPTIFESTYSQAASQADSRSPTPGITSQETHSDEETSLLSQDPEDEDAIPEWLMSD